MNNLKLFKEPKKNNGLRGKVIVVSGNIGVGKTTLINQLILLNGWKCTVETHDENPYLPKFYKDKKRWALQMELYFLATLVEARKKIIKTGFNVFLDRSIYDIKNVFIKALQKDNSFNNNDYNVFMRLYNIIEPTLKKPDLIIYPYASPSVLKDRINKRGRLYEKNIQKSYLKELNFYYNKWFDSETSVPVLRINAEKINFLNIKEVATKVFPIIMENIKTPKKIISQKGFK